MLDLRLAYGQDGTFNVQKVGVIALEQIAPLFEQLRTLDKVAAMSQVGGLLEVGRRNVGREVADASTSFSSRSEQRTSKTIPVS